LEVLFEDDVFTQFGDLVIEILSGFITSLGHPIHPSGTGGLAKFGATFNQELPQTEPSVTLRNEKIL
jgi:hypothetical protein